jgi:hypothetical protein
MPKYFFNIDGVDNLPRDRAGDDLPNDDAARAAAARQFQEVALEGSRENWDMTDWRIVVSSECGRTVADLPLSAKR